MSGGTPLEHRAGLRRAIEAVEAGEAEVIVAAYFDRLVRSLRVQDELVSRVEAAGGQVLAVDVGQVTNGSAGQWLSGTMLGAVSEYQRRTAASAPARRRRAPSRAACRRGRTSRPATSAATTACSCPIPATRARRRARRSGCAPSGATVAEVRAFLRAHGVERSYHGVGACSRSRVVLGEIHFGELDEPRRPRADRRPRAVAGGPAGRGTPRPASRSPSGCSPGSGCCAAPPADARMVRRHADPDGRRTPFYRCRPSPGDCARRVTISAELVEGIVTDAVGGALADVEGRASAETNVREAEPRSSEPRPTGRRDPRRSPASRTRRPRVSASPSCARRATMRSERVDQLGGTRAAVTVNAAADWERLTLAERRALIRATVDRVTVAPGRGAGRVTVELLGE